jgi:hypothetical protein
VKFYPYFPHFSTDSDDTRNRNRYLMPLSRWEFPNDGCSEIRKLLENINENLLTYSKILFNLDEI